MKRLFQNPLARKRWGRFRRRRRASMALCLLVLLYAVSLAAELICNSRPLYVRLNGRRYFPFCRNYPETLFTGSGRQTRPDYRALKRSETFAAGSGNVMLFAPVPFGPRESLDPSELAHEERVTLVFTPMPYVGSIYVDADLAVTRSTAAGHFFGTADAAVAGLRLDAAWQVDAALRDAVRSRLENLPAPEFTGQIRALGDASRVANVVMPAYTPRGTAPASTRLRLSRPSDPSVQTQRVRFTREGVLVEPAAAWAAVGPDRREELKTLVQQQVDSGVTSPLLTSIDGVQYRVSAETDVVRWPYRPVPGHWMGIDAAGHDVFARILYALRISMTFGLLLVLAAIVFGSLIGGIQGYFGGGVDIGGQRLIEIWSALPFLYIMILMGSVFGRSFPLLLICYGLFNWIGISYYMRAEFLRLRGQPFVEAARCMGIPPLVIMWRHILPNALTPLVTFFPFLLVGAIGSLAALDYLGFGLPPMTPSWGELLRQAQEHRSAWWLILYPSLALFTVMILGVFVGEGVRDACDPRPFSKME